jgi:hypothetical protein
LKTTANLYISAIKEMLSYFKDNKLNHISKGMDMLTQAVIQLNARIKEHHALLKAYKLKSSN